MSCLYIILRCYIKKSLVINHGFIGHAKTRSIHYATFLLYAK